MGLPDRIVMVRSPLRALLAAGWLLGLAGCIAPSEEELQRRFRDYVETANRCERDDECTLAGAGCPLGCFVAVRADRKADVEAKGRDLVEEYERYGRACAYGCIAPGPVICRQQRCLVLLEGTTPDGGSDSGP
jgi:hypothetical protein